MFWEQNIWLRRCIWRCHCNSAWIKRSNSKTFKIQVFADSETLFHFIIRNALTTERRLIADFKAEREAHNDEITDDIILIKKKSNGYHDESSYYSGIINRYIEEQITLWGRKVSQDTNQFFFRWKRNASCVKQYVI